MRDIRYGSVAERLGRALQKLLQRFESARNLIKKTGLKESPVFFYSINIECPAKGAAPTA